MERGGMVCREENGGMGDIVGHGGKGEEDVLGVDLPK